MSPPRRPSNNGTETETEPFPTIDETSPRSDNTDPPSPVENRPAASSSLSGRLRRVSQSFEVSGPPEGFMAATGTIASSIFTRQAAPRRTSEASIPMQSGPAAGPSRQSTFPVVNEEATSEEKASTSAASTKRDGEPDAAAPFPNGYHFPPKHTFAQSTKTGLIAFWNYFLTPLGFCVTIYGLNVVAWGGMLFLLLCNAAPAMCHPTCNDINSPRRKWIEWDSQILNALFCVTGFGLAPWRFRDLYFLLQYRVKNDTIALRRLGGIHRGWFRLPGSEDVDVNIGPKNVSSSPELCSSISVPFPEDKIPDAPLTGRRAPATPVWKMDAVVWLMVWNTFLQCVLAGFMWGLNRYDRPSWSTGLFVALACIVAAIGGIMMFIEGKKVKGIEGIPISEQDMQQLQEDRERGVWHFNNIKDKDLAEKEKKAAKK
ncbi:hypothetical protein NCS57_01047300 [Fusarium keratoplasticum]|uniref:Uncharacterized protein n=1 Tax=Fusarium keratoplasticum TaxID=1328300 RepID=A0ACC0QRJ7_9HYPO|nr:hypothetical protein NCS57_01047300 [Fusarium keratoplasticum]KAI8660694.1 hypothetical protein NCS57_01047300 [Fusarium keratoplasticum]KAI8661723.1 hypothetical protein NCS55_01043300 [Fusarium keratoplasticum]